MMKYNDWCGIVIVPNNGIQLIGMYDGFCSNLRPGVQSVRSSDKTNHIPVKGKNPCTGLARTTTFEPLIVGDTTTWR